MNNFSSSFIVWSYYNIYNHNKCHIWNEIGLYKHTLPSRMSHMTTVLRVGHFHMASSCADFQGCEIALSIHRYAKLGTLKSSRYHVTLRVAPF
jgi:hypothetical protein